MRITSITVQNFRKLFQCRIEFSEKTTLFVGANNSGKTSAMDALGKFLSNRMFSFNDITVSNRNIINKIGEAWVQPECETPVNLKDWDSVVPKMDVWLDVPCDEIYYVASIIPTLKWRGGRLGVRLAYLPRDISKLFSEFRNAYNTARKTEKGKSESATSLRLFPSCLCDYLEKKLTATFSMRAFILDPSKESDKFPQQTSFEMACLTSDPLKGIIKVDMIDAQRGFADPDNPDAGERVRRQLSEQMRIYYEKHLDPEKSPTVEDLELLQRTEDAQVAFDKTLADKFEPAIKELENLGYPGVADPKLTVSAKISTSDSISHSSAVQYSLSEKDDTLKLPEKYNGLGYQNLISIVFNLMGFRDGWMRIGKYDPDGGQAESAIEPLHLVLIEEPEAHLHMQVQQVFIRQAYNVLTNRKEIQENIHYKTQLIISTHSSHIAREMNFANLRYFKRLPEGTECAVATSKVINLSDVFGKEDRTDKFVTRYLQTTHCDLFFADAAILVEGAAENMLVPHFIREKHNKLNQKYISILMINGRHSHRLGQLIMNLCLPTLVIADLDTVEKAGHHKAAFPERNKGLITTNYAISNWLLKEKDVDILVDLPAKKKEIHFKSPYPCTIRIAYQTPITLNFQGAPYEVLARTFEDSLIFTNYDLFKSLQSDKLDGFVKDAHDIIVSATSIDELQQKIYDMIRDSSSECKAQFALDLIYDIDPSDIAEPGYIQEGLDWLYGIVSREEM